MSDDLKLRHRTRARPQSPASPGHRKPRDGTPTTCSTPARDDESRRHKVASIKRSLLADPCDITTLRQLAISREGLLSDELRKKAWAKLINANVENILPKPDEEILHGHRDYNQVVLDVNRSIKRFPPGMEEQERMGYQDQLIDTIMRVLVNNDELHYYQGYHDVVVTFLLVIGEDLTFAVMDNLSRNHLRDFMDVNMDKTKHMLNFLYPIVGRADPKLKDFLEKSEVGTIFCLSWLITWYGHVLSEFKHIVRLYDFFIACHPLMPIYLAAAIVLYRREDILACECEMPYVHSLLSKISDDLPFEQLISHAGDLFVQYPPKALTKEAEEQYERAQKKLDEATRDAKAAGLKPNKWNRLQKAGIYSKKERSIIFRVTMWTLSAAVTAAAVTLLNTATEWDGWISWGWFGK